MVLEGFLLLFFIVLRTVKYKSSSPGLFVSFYDREGLTCKLRFDSSCIGMVCLKLKQLNLLEMHVLLGFVAFMCPFINNFCMLCSKIFSLGWCSVY